MTETLPESFTLDHDAVVAPFVRLAGRTRLTGGGEIVKWDVRFTQPNISHLEMPVVHSIEHMLATTLREFTDAVVDISPMGCQTGFYVAVDAAELGTFAAFTDVLAHGIERALELDAVPGASRIECGQAASHTRDGAQSALRGFLAQRAEWEHVFGVSA